VTDPLNQAELAKARNDFLMKMYDQMYADINRNVLVVWQSIGVLVGALAVYALVEKQVIPLDFATTFVLLICGWSVAHLYEATYWYNRNLAIIANIERQFLTTNDLQDIQYYFGEHRQVNKMLDQFKIQYALAIAIAFLFLVFHFVMRVVPGIGAPWRGFEIQRALPYVFVLAIAGFIFRFKGRYEKKYREFLKNSPGISVDIAAVQFGVGHPVEDLSAVRSEIQRHRRSQDLPTASKSPPESG
jgi:hypothetical protein